MEKYIGGCRYLKNFELITNLSFIYDCLFIGKLKLLFLCEKSSKFLHGVFENFSLGGQIL